VGITNSTRATRWTAGSLSAVAITVLLAAAPAAAQPGVFEIPIDTVVRQPPASVTLLASFDVPPDQQSLTCTADSVAVNQQSVHPDNDLIVETGGSTEVIPDVESQPDGTSEIVAPVVLGETLTVSLRMGPDGVFSGGLVVTVDCQQPPTTTTTTVPTTTTTVPPTTVPPTVPATVPPSTAPTTIATTTPSTSPPQPTTTVPVVAQSTIANTGADTTESGFFGGLALVAAGAFLVVLAEFSRRIARRADTR